jgi:peroxiredoxin
MVLDVHFIADDAGAFSKAIGLTFDATAALGTPRSKAMTLIVLS